jgi:hypothetical protein
MKMLRRITHTSGSKYTFSALFGSLLIALLAAAPLILSSVSARARFLQAAEAEQEPNETAAAANPISFGGRKTGTARFGDAASFEYAYSNGPRDKIEDFFKFSIPAGQQRRVDLSLIFTNADLDLFLFKIVNGNLFAVDISNDGAASEKISPALPLESGDYFVGVSAYDDPTNTAQAAYALTLTTDSAAPAPEITAISPQAVTAGVSSFTLTISGTRFEPTSVAHWNGAPLTTIFVTDEQLVMFVPATAVAAEGVAKITVVNPAPLGGASAPVDFTILPVGSPDPEIEPNESSAQATLLLLPGKRGGQAAVGDASTFTIRTPNGAMDAIEDFYAVNLPGASLLDLKLVGRNPSADLALYLIKENGASSTVLGNSRLSGPVQQVTTVSPLPPGRYLVGVSAVTGSSAYTIEASQASSSGGFEGDVSPRSTGDGVVSPADWTQVGRFVAGVDAPAEGGEFQRADCAPRETRGDGRLTLADWVMVGRFASGVDTPLPAGGPTKPAGAAPARFEKRAASELTAQPTRILRVVGATFSRGQAGETFIELNAEGNENAVAFTLNFDASQLTFTNVALGPDGTGAILNLNTSQVDQGRVGVSMALPSGQTIAAGVRRILRLNFTVPQTSAVNATSISFVDSPVAREVIDVAAASLTADFTAGEIKLIPEVDQTPVIASLSPETVIVGGPSFVLTVKGRSFASGAVVRLNGSARATEYVNSSELRGLILAEDIAETGAQAVAVANPEPDSAVSNTLNFSVVQPAPALSSLSPASAGVGGAALSLTVTGTGFTPESNIQWNGNSRVTNFLSPTQLSTLIAASDLQTAGEASVRVINPAPGGGLSQALAFKILAPSPIPRLAALSPNPVQAGGGAFLLTATGTGFASTSVIRVNSSTLATTYVSAAELKAEVPAAEIAAVGTAPVTIFTPAPGGGTSNVLLLTINTESNPSPKLTALNPATVPSGSGAFTLTVTGTGFSTASIVRLNGADRTTTFISTTELRASVAAADVVSGGSAAITVFNPPPNGGASNALALTITFGSPSITALSPESSVVGGPAFTLTVFGANFGPGSIVRWNSQDRPTTRVSGVELTAQISAADIAAIGAADVSVWSNGVISPKKQFQVTQAARPVPRITVISPTQGGAGGAAFILTVTGANFVADSVVRWNGQARATTFVDSTRLTAQIPASDLASAGSVAVTVFTAPAGGGESNSATFTISQSQNPVPAVTTLAPASAVRGGAPFVLTINGSGFVSGTIAQVNGSARPTTVVGPTQLTIQITAEDLVIAGALTLRVVSPEPGGGTSNDATLPVLNPTPAITALNPNIVAERNPAFNLFVTGTGFAPGAQIALNGVPRITTLVDATTVMAVIQTSDVETIGSINIQVINPTPGGGASNTIALEVRQRNPLPRLTSVAPDTVDATGEGFQLTIGGSGFIRGTIVRVNGKDRPTEFTSETALTAQIPAEDILAGGLLQITVFNSLPGGGTSNPLVVTVRNPEPRITTLNPTTVVARSVGFDLLVNGSGFSGNSVVRFNGDDLPTTYISPSQLSAAVPASSILFTGAVTVQVVNPSPGGGSSNSRSLTIAAPASLITGLTPFQTLSGGPAFTLTVNGEGFIPGAVIRVKGEDRATNRLSANQLTAQITAADIAQIGALSISVFTPGVGGGASNTVALNVINSIPTISSLDPGAVTAGSVAFPLSVTGSDFMEGAVVRWNGSPRPTNYLNQTNLVAQITAADVASAGTVEITVANPSPGGGVSTSVAFTIRSEPNPTPTITALNPSSVYAGSGGFSLSVAGTNFTPGAVVKLNGADRATTFSNSTKVTAEISASDVQSPGSASITVTNPAPGGGASNALTLAIAAPNPAPTLTSLVPAAAAAGGSAFNLMLTGSGFRAASIVHWNGAARPTTFVSETQLTAQISAADVAAVGTAAVTVSNPAPGGGVSGALTFTISNTVNPTPTITAINPASVFAGDEAFTLVVTGSNFVAGAVIEWKGTARPTTIISATELRTEISAADVAEAGAVQITISNPAPGGGRSGALVLQINALNCQVICLQSAQYYQLVADSRLPRGYLYIGGVNFNNQVSIQTKNSHVRRALPGGSSALQQLNRQYVALQLSLLAMSGPFPPATVLQSSLRCYGVNFDAVTLGNGVKLSRNTTLAELLAETRSAIIGNRSDDMEKLAAVLALLNGDSPSSRCQ